MAVKASSNGGSVSYASPIGKVTLTMPPPGQPAKPSKPGCETKCTCVETVCSTRCIDTPPKPTTKKK